jgi:hypothetical protein
MNRIARWFVMRKLNQIEKNIKEGKMKRGIFTSEFWLGLLTTVLVYFSDKLGVDPVIRDKIVQLVLAYIASRTVVKVADGIKKPS